MRTEHAHPRSTVYVGDCRQAMAEHIAPRSVQCVVTSPPYWGLRDYGIPPVAWEDGESAVFGLESTVEGYVRHTLEIFRGLDRVLRDDGVIWWNLGDTFAQPTKWGGRTSGKHRAELHSTAARTHRKNTGHADGNKLLIPYRVAIALQDAGWVVREDVIWAKPSPMPISVNGVRWERCRVKVANGVANGVTKQGSHENRQVAGFNERYSGRGAKWQFCPGCDKCRASDGWVLRLGRWRTTTSHEVILMVTRPGGYFCDATAAAEKSEGTAHSRGHKLQSPKELAKAENGDGHGGWHRATLDTVETRNPRSVWRISSEPLKEKHFAAYPSALAWKCIQASTSAPGCCPVCGACYAPQVTKERVPTRPALNPKDGWKHDDADTIQQRSELSPNRDPQRHIQRTVVHGYRPTCDCNAGEPVPCVVYDPFAGSGTTLAVAVHSGRIGIGSEISEQYLDIQSRRIPQVPRCFQATGKGASQRRRKPVRYRQLFYCEPC